MLSWADIPIFSVILIMSASMIRDIRPLVITRKDICLILMITAR